MHKIGVAFFRKLLDRFEHFALAVLHLLFGQFEVSISDGVQVPEDQQEAVFVFVIQAFETGRQLVPGENAIAVVAFIKHGGDCNRWLIFALLIDECDYLINFLLELFLCNTIIAVYVNKVKDDFRQNLVEFDLSGRFIWFTDTKVAAWVL